MKKTNIFLAMGMMICTLSACETMKGLAKMWKMPVSGARKRQTELEKATT